MGIIVCAKSKIIIIPYIKKQFWSYQNAPYILAVGEKQASLTYQYIHFTDLYIDQEFIIYRESVRRAMPNDCVNLLASGKIRYGI